VLQLALRLVQRLAIGIIEERVDRMSVAIQSAHAAEPRVPHAIPPAQDPLLGRLPRRLDVGVDEYAIWNMQLMGRPRRAGLDRILRVLPSGGEIQGDSRAIVNGKNAAGRRLAEQEVDLALSQNMVRCADDIPPPECWCASELRDDEVVQKRFARHTEQLAVRRQERVDAPPNHDLPPSFLTCVTAMPRS
jgi:hypothetical protein